MAAAAAPLPKLTVVKATYGQGPNADISAKVSALIASSGGNLSILASANFNTLFGDTQPGVAKLFHLVYAYGPNGAQKSMTHGEKHPDIYLPALEIKQGQVLTVNVIKAVGLRDTRTLGKQNPYAKLTTGSESFKTKHHEKGGTDPVWNQSFIFNLDGKDQYLHVVVYDKETISDDTIARFDIPLPTLAAATGEVAYNLVHPNDFKKVAGAIVLSCDFRDPNAPVIPAAAAAAPAAAAAAPAVQQPQVVYMQPQQPQVVYMQPAAAVVYAPPQPVFQMPQVVYQQPQVVYQQPQVVYQAPQQKQPEVTVWPGVSPGANDVAELNKCPHSRFKYDGSYIIAHDGRVFDVQGGSPAVGAPIITWQKKSGSDVLNQQWDYRDGMFITRMGTGLCITVDGDVKSGSGLVTGQAYGAPNQTWDIDQFGFVHCKQDRNQCWSLDGSGKVLVWEQHPGIKYGPAPAAAAAARTVVRVRQQGGWRWCGVCQALFFSSVQGNGICAAGGSHDPSGSAEYLANQERDEPSSQDAWRWCYKCSCMCYPALSTSNVCCTGGQHTAGGEPYFMMRGNQEGEQGFKWCSRCGVLAYASKGGRCAATNGAHDFNGSGAYVVSRRS